MKLFRYTYKRLSIILFALLAVWGTAFYFTIIYEVVDETNDTLDNYKRILIGMVLKDSTLLDQQNNLLTRYEFRPLTEAEGRSYHQRYYDATVYIESEDEYEPVRVLATAFMLHNEEWYELKIMISTLERDDMVEAILIHILVLYLLFFIILGIITNFTLKKVFKPLNKLVNWFNSIKLGQPLHDLDNETNIEEFRHLNQAAVSMSKRSERIFNQQKEFIENAAHELQTPLAIVSGKLELLADSGNLTEAQMNELAQTLAVLNRAVKINKSLLLLSRIDNDQFATTAPLNLTELFQQLLPDLAEIYTDKNLTVEQQFSGNFQLEANELLMQMLVTNLLKNAFLHTPDNGNISIQITDNQIVIKNSGDVPLDNQKVFTRFYHPQQGSQTTGLGLSIIASISARYNLKTTYEWRNGEHYFKICRNS